MNDSIDDLKGKTKSQPTPAQFPKGKFPGGFEEISSASNPFQPSFAPSQQNPNTSFTQFQ
jgi:hypothetical protein